jgi:myosin heavy subunit
MIFFKYSFDSDRKELVSKNKELERLNKELTQQTDQLQETNSEIQAIKDNLQEKVIARTKKLEEENKKLLEYSFINAHLVRAPMANIIGITDLNPDDPKFEKIKEGIAEMDEVVRKIANVLK